MTDRDASLHKRVQWKATDDERQIATGVVMVPDKVDLQGDFERESTIRDMAEGFMQSLSAGQAEGGVMHGVFPGHSTLVENAVLDEPREIGGKEFPAGTWTQSWQFDDGELWSLVRDGILAGYSIGAKEVDWSDAMAQSELPGDVAVAEDYPEDEPAYELQSASVREVSAVDIPAVPDAEILATKADEEKRLADHLGNKEQFLEEAAERGHSDGEAERLWSYLNRAANETVDEESASEGVLQRIGKAALNAATFGSGGDEAEKEAAEKESRTLSEENRKRLMAAHDAVEDALTSDVDFRTNRFTDDPAVEFDVAEYGKVADSDAVDGTDEGGKNADDDMTDNEDTEPPEWAKDLQEQIEENNDRIEAALDGEGEKSGGEKSEKDAWEEAPEWAEELKESTEKNSQRIDDVAKASGTSQQVGDAQPESTNRQTSKAWDDTLGLPGGDA